MTPEAALQFSPIAQVARAILLVLVVISLALALVGRMRSDEAAPMGGTGRPAPGHSFQGPVPV